MRATLGAQAADVAQLVLGERLSLAVGGVALGIAATISATRALRGVLYGVSPTDPVTFIAIALLLGAVALLASCLPARRALRLV